MGKRLGKLVDDRLRELGMSARDVSRHSGGLVSHTTVSAARKGLPGKTFEKRTLHALASALTIPPQDLFNAYDEDMKEVKPRSWVLPAEADTLSSAGRKALLAHLEWLLEQERQVARRQVKRGRTANQ